MSAIDLFDAFSTDTAAEEVGKYTKLPDCGDTDWLIARSGNRAYNKLLTSLYKRNRAVLDSKGDEAQKKSEEILAEVFSKTILLGWKGDIKFQGKMHPYSQELAKKLLGFKDFRAKVSAVSEDFTTFKTVEEGDDIPN